ncbi:hypothetical protein Acr_27g0004900 [Actinidia rufa]|uniref:Uncharacterized protein n=1 Tax=Actinidia rufa TaxID=165716 RepID=A0A7J0H6U1_9ERIC|nr:hypothetical protein Acr_00g0001580 [Actinidia rufa]GFY94551.1 hypothetical protein Acr_09g0009970 [Actinidia rufa]GFY94553.1 hypothetical protein Acr_09g0009990 [Actinidia rufa]GFZ18751.1 hypothetical protein Acr_27g0004900 [Actinidia rufa]
MDHPIGVKELPFLLLKYKLPLWRVDGQMPASRKEAIARPRISSLQPDVGRKPTYILFTYGSACTAQSLGPGLLATEMNGFILIRILRPTLAVRPEVGFLGLHLKSPLSGGARSGDAFARNNGDKTGVGLTRKSPSVSFSVFLRKRPSA